jgi:hypothetical protein
VRISLIWRYITASVVKELNKDAVIDGMAEYTAAQKKWLETKGGK